MKKKIKTYGVKGLMEWMCNIPVGKTHLQVEFTGGVLTQYGNTPAKFTTDDMLKQAIIENSKPFKNGKITLLSCIESQEDETRRLEGGNTSNETDTDDNEDNSNDDKQQASEAPEAQNVVEVESLDDAKEYLNQKYGIAVRNLRSRQAIIDAAKECGFSFKGL